MPELPEVETARRGIEPHLVGQTISEVRIRNPRLRWPIPTDFAARITGAQLLAVARRAKYLLLQTDRGTAIVHLGMSGSLRVLAAATPPNAHDHWDLCLTNGQCLRLRDPRRFGALLFTNEAPAMHPLLRDLGPEPLESSFSGAHLHARARGKRVALRDFLLDGKVVAGVGNIYASEAAFEAELRPQRAVGRISRGGFDAVARAIQRVLSRAIRAGGTTLRDFQNADGEPGYFNIELQVYDRAGESCRRCGGRVKMARRGQRSLYYCPGCQR
ncbi:MAG: bifunctional DNA-formamidopyrimidine glycosylase/DNA-(apurinic or apyrimidinic site) lyase [Planctomycetota bacterium]